MPQSLSTSPPHTQGRGRGGGGRSGGDHFTRRGDRRYKASPYGRGQGCGGQDGGQDTEEVQGEKLEPMAYTSVPGTTTTSNSTKLVLKHMTESYNSERIAMQNELVVNLPMMVPEIHLLAVQWRTL
jgi:hypothetical protein